MARSRVIANMTTPSRRTLRNFVEAAGVEPPKITCSVEHLPALQVVWLPSCSVEKRPISREVAARMAALDGFQRLAVSYSEHVGPAR